MPVDDASRIPTYKLFGETELWPAPEPMHYETIVERSSLYDWEITPHRHDNLFQILFLESGGAGMTLETQSGALPTPCIVAMPPRRVHGYSFSPDVVGHIVTMPQFLLGELLVPSPELHGELGSPHRHLLGDEAASLALLRQLFHRLREEYTGSRPGRVSVMLAILTHVLVWLARAGGSARQDVGQERFAQRLDRFHELIDRNFRERRPVSFYAGQLGVSTVQLNIACRRKTGRSAQQLIHDRLLLEARRLLAYSDLDVASISYALGFRDPSYFSRFFTKAQGTAPSAFRQLHGRAREG
ncbi:PobR regulator [Thauera sinica]|nr:PobR regulator [Thauera sp. K11]